MEEFNKNLEEVTAYLIGTKDKETVNGYKDTVLELCKQYHKQQLILNGVMHFKKYLKMKINKKILARTILILLLTSFMACVWIFIAKEFVYFLVGLIVLNILLIWSSRHA